MINDSTAKLVIFSILFMFVYLGILAISINYSEMNAIQGGGITFIGFGLYFSMLKLYGWQVILVRHKKKVKP